jgi:O-antigen/teichoic acid export membrane protein
VSKALLKDSFLYTLSSFLGKGIGFILLPLYTAIFTPSDYGVMDLIALSIVLISNVFSFQTNQSLSRYYVETKSSIRKKSYFTTIFIYYILIYFLVTISLFLYNEEFSFFIFNTVEYTNIITLAALNIFFGSIYYIGSNLYRLDFESKKYSILSIFQLILSSFFILFAIMIIKTGLIGVFIGQLLAYIILLIFISKKIASKINIKLFSIAILIKMFRFGVPLVPTVLVLLVMQYIDRIMITNMIGLESLGQYAVAMKIASIITLLLSGFQLAFGPYVFSNYKNPKTKETIALYFYVINILSLMIVSFLMLFSFDILQILTNVKYIEAHSIVPLLALSTFFFSIGAYFSIGFAIVNRNEIQTVIYLIIIFINIALNYLLIEKYGIKGASIATMLSFFLSAIINLIISNKYYQIQFNIKNLSFYAIQFIGVILLYNLFVKNNTSFEDYLFKILILLSWCIPIFLLENQRIKRCYSLIKERVYNK